MDSEIKSLSMKLSPLERKLLPHLEKPIIEISKDTGLDRVSLLRGLKFLENKKVIEISSSKERIVILGVNGIYYKKNGLPERRLLETIEKNNFISLNEAKKVSKLTDNEFKVSLGTLKKKALVEIKNGKLHLNASKQEISKKSQEELFIDLLPKKISELEPQERYAFENLKSRKDIVEIKEKNEISIKITSLGENLINSKIDSDLLEEVTPEIIKNWKKNKKFRAYDLESPLPKIYPGKRHFVNQAIEYGRRIWLDLGFQEMSGTMTQSSFWNFDALFTAQDHPVREMHDTFYIKDTSSRLPDKKLMKNVKECHEKGVDKSKGWQYSWKQEDAEKAVLRTHTTCLSAQTLSKLKKEDLPAKFFSIGKNFRNETVDWSHGFEFYQTEGIVIDEKANFRHLLGYLKEFYKKMGFEKIRFSPAYFPYTEPSVEISVYHKEKKVWLELGGAGVFRPEITIPLMGIKIPVLAWGQGFDRIITDYYKIKDLREMYSNDIKKIREIKVWRR